MLKTAAFLLCASVAYCVALQGIDVPENQKVNWADAKNKGVEFAYIMATEGITFKNSQFRDQYSGALKAGIIRGAYHVAQPDRSTGAAEATFFLEIGRASCRERVL